MSRTYLPLEDLADAVSDKIFGAKNSNLPYVGLEQLAQNESRLLGTLTSDMSVSINSMFKSGDVLFGKLRPNLRKSVQVDFSGYCSTDIIVLRAKTYYYSGFVARIFQSAPVFDAAVRFAEGTKMPRTSWDKLKALQVFVPGHLEQRRIAAVLDVLDETIAATEALIAKLKAVRQGLLHDLLTRGLDEHGELRDPEQFRISGWQKYLLGNLISLEYGVGLPESSRTGKGFSVYGSSGEVGQHEYCLVSGPGIIVGRKGTVGACFWSVEDFWPIDTTYYVKAKPLINLRWCYWLLKTLSLSRLDSSTGVPGLNRNDVYKLSIVLPPLLEQRRIAAILNSHDTHIQIEETYLAKLRQLKHGLMDDLLTGRVRIDELSID